MDNSFVKVFNKIGDSISMYGVAVIEVYRYLPQNKYAFPIYERIAYAKLCPGEYWGVAYKRLHDPLNKHKFTDNETVRSYSVEFEEAANVTKVSIYLEHKEGD